MNIEQIIRGTFHYPDEVLPFGIQQRLTELNSGRSVVMTSSYEFALNSFIRYGHCVAFIRDSSQSLVNYYSSSEQQDVVEEPEIALIDIRWNGHEIGVFTYPVRYTRYWHVIADSEWIARDFIDAVYRRLLGQPGQVVVFDGEFSLSEQYEKACQSVRRDDVILAGGLRDRLIEDCQGFFQMKSSYHDCGLVWKRGLLLYGPPGNGKTSMLKLLVKELMQPALVVRTFEADFEKSSVTIARIFEQARKMAPMVMVFEDLDSLVSSANLSVFLNEMDGLRPNDGILTLATTNHPDDLDPALANRPSRFDRKVEFAAPDEDCRFEYLTHQIGRVAQEMRIGDEKIKDIAKRTDGFSFAMLQELVTSSMIVWFRHEGKRAMDEVLREQARELQPTKGEKSSKVAKKRKK